MAVCSCCSNISVCQHRTIAELVEEMGFFVLSQMHYTELRICPEAESKSKTCEFWRKSFVRLCEKPLHTCILNLPRVSLR